MSTSVQPFKVGDRVIYNWLADDRFLEGDDPTKPFTVEIEIGTVKVLSVMIDPWCVGTLV